MWIFQSFASAAIESAWNAASRATSHRHSPEMFAWWTRLAAAVTAALFALAWRGHWPALPTTAQFWIPTCVSIALNTIASVLYARALHYDLSLTMPITALSPAFLLMTEPLFTGRAATFGAAIGVGVIAVGMYVLNLPALRTHGLLGPFKNVWREEGPRCMLLVVLIWSITGPCDKLAVDAYDPLWYVVFLHGGIGLLLTPVLVRATRRSGESIRSGWWMLAFGIFGSSTAILQMSAFAAASATYVTAIRRFAAPLSTLWGWLYFKEPHIAARLLGTLIMTAGAILMLLSL